MGCLGGIVLLNLVFELKFLDVFMGREDPIEFNIIFPCGNCWFDLYWFEVSCSVLLGRWEGMFLTPLYFYIFIYISLIHLF